MTAATDMLTFKRGDVIFTQGQPSSGAYRITSGIVKLVRSNEQGEEAIIAFRANGQIFGEDAIDSERATDAVVISECLELEILQAGLIQAWEIFEQYQLLARRTELLILHDLEYRTRYLLSELAELMGPVLPLTQVEFGQYVGSTRETASTLLNKLEREGLVKLGRGSITVLQKKDAK